MLPFSKIFHGVLEFFERKHPINDRLYLMLIERSDHGFKTVPMPTVMPCP